MDENEEPRRRGRKPLPPDERMQRRGRKRILQAEINERKQQGAPPLQISFVCDVAEGRPSSSTDATDATTNPFNFREEREQPRASREDHNKENTLNALTESSDDDNCIASEGVVRMDVSALSEERCIELLGAHTDRSDWPISTEFSCWNCTYPFESIPLAIPRRQHRASKKLMDCYGVFCSFNCAKRYCLTKNDFDRFQSLQLLALLKKKLLGEAKAIIPAPPFQALARFGGYMGIEEYRKNSVHVPPSSTSEAGRMDFVSIMQKNCVPTFCTVLHSHSEKLQTTSKEERDRRNTKYQRTKPLPGSMNFNNMNVQRN